MRAQRALSRAAGAAVGKPWLVVFAVVAVVFGFWVVGTRNQTHHVRAVFDDAISIAPGLDVTVNGLDVGKVSGVRLVDGQAVVDLGIDDESVWPLRRGTRAATRFGTTVGNGTRRVELWPGPADAPALPEGGVITAQSTSVPTEFDQVFQTFGPHTRADLQRGQARARAVLRGEGPALRSGIAGAGPALDAVGDLARQLVSDEVALRELIGRTDDVTRTLAARQGRISSLVTVAARTFGTFAANTRGVRESLDRLPATLRESRATLARLEPSLDRLDGLVADVRPGARLLRPLAAVARPTFAELRRTAPRALRTVRSLSAAAPGVTLLLAQGDPFAQKATPILADLAPMTSCLRPYAPEAAGFLANWAGFTKNYDGTSHYARVRVVEGETSANDQPNVTTEQFVKATGASYAGLRPPGLNAGQPWLLPECGLGPDVLDPAKDWEDGR